MSWRDRWRAVMEVVNTEAKASAEYAGSAYPLPGPQPPGADAVRQAVQWAMGLTPAEVWTSQPYVRMVVSFLARNVAQLGVHTFSRVSDTDRRRLGAGHPVVDLLAKPNPGTTRYRFIEGLVLDKLLYDRTYHAIGRDRNTGRWSLVRIPPARIVSHNSADPILGVTSFGMIGSNGIITEVPADRIFYVGGFNPLDPYGLPSSPVDSLKPVIAEQAAAFAFREATWSNGGQVAQVINRPADAPDWSAGAKARFMDEIRSEYSKGGSRVGGIALLEDGMTMSSAQWNAHDAEWIEAAKLSLALVAATWHVNPTMVGLLDNANYSNVREFRRSLYGDTLGPLLAEFEDALNSFLVPLLVPDEADRTYVEFNIAEKLQGSFEEQATAMQTAVGAPWMTRGEARGRLNLPTLPSDSQADELIVPLNVLVGGQASPTDSAPPTAPNPVNPNDVPSGSSRTVQGKAARRLPAPKTDHHLSPAQEALSAFWKRQGESVLARIGGSPGKASWWAQDRWNRELAADLSELGLLVSTDAAAQVLKSADLDPAAAYDVERTKAFLGALAERIASGVNAATKRQLDDALANGTDPAEVFAPERTDARALTAATTLVTTFAMFGATEAAKQGFGARAYKVWETGHNPRPEHAALNGQTVGVEEPFSNGAQWPGDDVLDVDQRAGCNCSTALLIQ